MWGGGAGWIKMKDKGDKTQIRWDRCTQDKDRIWEMVWDHENTNGDETEYFLE